MLLKWCTQYAGKLSSGLVKVSFHCSPKEGQCQRMFKYIVLISHTRKVMLKILQARLQQYMNQELPNEQVRFRKGRGNRDQIAKICWVIEKAREFQKNIYRFIDYTCTDHVAALWLSL